MNLNKFYIVNIYESLMCQKGKYLKPLRIINYIILWSIYSNWVAIKSLTFGKYLKYDSKISTRKIYIWMLRDVSYNCF